MGVFTLFIAGSHWKKKEVPDWVKPWLENYIKAQAFDAMIETAEQLKNDQANSRNNTPW